MAAVGGESVAAVGWGVLRDWSGLMQGWLCERCHAGVAVRRGAASRAWPVSKSVRDGADCFKSDVDEVGYRRQKSMDRHHVSDDAGLPSDLLRLESEAFPEVKRPFLVAQTNSQCNH